MYLSSKETRVTGSLLLTNLVKARSIIMLAISGSVVRQQCYDRSNKNQMSWCQDYSAYIRRQYQRLKFPQGGLA